MARKQTQHDITQLTFYLDKNIAAEFKELAAKDGQPYADILRDLVEGWITYMEEKANT